MFGEENNKTSKVKNQLNSWNFQRKRKTEGKRGCRGREEGRKEGNKEEKYSNKF